MTLQKLSNIHITSALNIANILRTAHKVREVRCSSLLHEMNRGNSFEYTLNMYRGCAHGCVYCYAPSLIHDERSWGSYVDVKINAPNILNRELRRAEKRVVFLSSASDPYQPAEGKYKLTRQALEILLKHEFPVLILTRSPLVLRDLDLLKKFFWLRVGFSISSVSSSYYEPGVPPLQARITALKKLSDEGISTWVSLAPVIPQLILTDLELLFRKLEEVRVATVTIGLLRFKGYEESKEMFEYRSGRAASEVSKGSTEICEKIANLARVHGIDTSGCCLSFKRETEQTLDRFTR